LNADNLDGLISWASTYNFFMPNEEIVEFHKNLGTLPAICIGMPVDNIPSLYIDDSSGIKKLMMHLIKDHGYKKIGFVGIENKKHYSYISRYDSYLNVLKELDIPYNDDLYFKVNELGNKQEIKIIVDSLLERKTLENKEIEAIVAISDVIAFDLVEELYSRGINVPNDIAVCGFNNHLESIRSTPSLTTIDPHFFGLGYKAVEMILSSIKGERLPLTSSSSCDIIIRQSCGCLEEHISNAKYDLSNKISGNRNNLILSDENTNIILIQLTGIIKNFNEKFDYNSAEELLNNLLLDLKENSSFKFLNTIKKYFFDYKNVFENRLLIWQNVISDIRTLFLSYFNLGDNLLLKFEDIFHQTRVMVDVAYSYLNFSIRGEQYQIGTLIKISNDLRIADDLNQIVNIIKIFVEKLDIPGVYLSLFDEPKSDLSKSQLVLAHDLNNEIKVEREAINTKIGRIFSRNIFPENRRYSMIFELLFFKEKYLGFMIMEMGPRDLTLYDTLRKLLSPSIYVAMINKKKKEVNHDGKLLINRLKSSNSILNESIKETSNDSIPEGRELSAYKILTYLSTNINVLTDIDVIANDLNISKSSLMRKSKILTGYSVQKLHEMLKIEKAKELLESKQLSISEISYYLGYQDQLYFSRVFKKNTGFSPKKWAEVFVAVE